MTVAVSVSAAGVLPVFLTAALAVQIRDDLDLSVAALGALVGVFFGVSALGSAPLGRVVERRGWASGIQLAAIGSGLTQIGMATVARNAWTIGALFIVGGLAAAMSRPAADFALTRSVPPCRHGLLLSQARCRTGCRHAWRTCRPGVRSDHRLAVGLYRRGRYFFFNISGYTTATQQSRRSTSSTWWYHPIDPDSRPVHPRSGDSTRNRLRRCTRLFLRHLRRRSRSW